MITLFRKLWRAFLYDDAKVRRWGRGFLLWLSTAMALVILPGFEAAEKWTLRQWVFRLAIAGVAGTAGLISVGEKNPRPNVAPEPKVPVP